MFYEFDEDKILTEHFKVAVTTQLLPERKLLYLQPYVKSCNKIQKYFNLKIH